MFLVLLHSVQAVLEESPTMEGAIPIPNFGEVTSPVKVVEKESAMAVDDVGRPAQQKESMPSRTMPGSLGDAMVGGSQAPQPAISLVPKASTQGGPSSSALEGREDVSFHELYAGAIAQFDQWQALLVKMKQEYEVCFTVT